MDKRQLIPIVGLIATIAIAMFMVAQAAAQSPMATGDFSNAAVAEVRDAQGQIILRGQFTPVDADDDDIERKAELQSTGIEPDAEGEAEVETTTGPNPEQEIEFSIEAVQPGVVYTFVIDGKDVCTATADNDGEAELEITLTRQ
jgi:hypothetical protein